MARTAGLPGWIGFALWIAAACFVAPAILAAQAPAAETANALGTSSSIAPIATIARSATTLKMSSGGKEIASGSSLAWGSGLDLTATVEAEGKTLTGGIVSFCDAAAEGCTDIHLLGTAAIAKTGAATLRFHPGIGAHQYKAIFNGTPNGKLQVKESISNEVNLTVAGHYCTQTTIAQTGNANSYTLTATVAGLVNSPDLPAPSGAVPFVDTTSGGRTIATADLGEAVSGLSFPTSQTPSTGSFPFAIVSGDFNGDGIPDLAIGNDDYDGPISILLGKGDGTFRQARGSPFKTPGGVIALAAGDFNGDGVLDLAGVTSGDNGVLIVLMGKGDGTFDEAKESTIPIGGPFNNLNSLAVGDFNGDGNLDLVVLAGTEYTRTPSGVYVLLGNGAGQFSYAEQTPIPVSVSAYAVAIADFNGDGIPDLAIANWSSDSVSILLGKGDGTFAAAKPPRVPVGVEPDAIAAGDFNGDGKIDLAVANANSEGTGSVSVLLGNGNGTFKEAAHSPIKVGATPSAILTADFNRDGKPDLAVVNGDSDSVSVFLGDGDGTFKQAPASPLLYAGQFPQSLASADFNGDGVPDFAITTQGNGSAYVYLAQPTQSATATAGGISRPASGKHLVETSFSAEGIFTGSTSPTTTLYSSLITPVVMIEASSPIAASQPEVVSVFVSGSAGDPTPTGSVTLTDGKYSSGAHVLGAATGSTNVILIEIPAGALPLGTSTLTATYGPDSPSAGTYSKASASQSITVNSSQ